MVSKNQPFPPTPTSTLTPSVYPICGFYLDAPLLNIYFITAVKSTNIGEHVFTPKTIAFFSTFTPLIKLRICRMQLMPDKADNQYYYFMDLRCRSSELSYPVLAGLEPALEREQF